MTDLVLRRDDALSADALAMIGESEAELAALYAPEHRYAFSPEQLLDVDVRFLTAYRDEKPIGCGGIAPCEGYGELKRIFVTISLRGQGIAARIVGALEDVARQDGYDLVRLETGLASPDALALYRKLGYREIAPFGTYVDNGSSVFMEKTL
ncbi:MAG: GNAT family N-acetyltransferase [Pseudomonadota bacterium]